MTRLLSAVLFVVVIGGAYVAVRGRDLWGRTARVTPPTLTTSGAPAGSVPIDDRRRQLIGVRTARVSRGSLEPTLRAAGTVGYAEPRVVDVNLKVNGWLTELYVDAEGQSVKRGQPLFRVFSPELLAAQNELIAALRNRDLMEVSKAENAREFSERVLDAPKRTLTRLDVSPDQIQALEKTRQVPTSVVFGSATDGVVIEKSAVPGTYVEQGKTILRLADLSEVWIEADFPESDSPSLRIGAPATITFGAWPGQRFQGRIEGIYPRLAETNRKLRARIAVRNRDGRLRLGMYANVEVAAAPVEGLVVPSDAIVDSGKRTIAFVAKGDGYFEPRDVVVGRSTGGNSVVVDGLRENEEVATRATFFIDSESRLGASLQSYDSPASATARPAGEPHGFDVSFVTVPDPPRSGQNEIEVRVLNSQRQPVDDAEIRVELSMPAMPSMNMPEMRSEARLPHVGNGVYRGPASISMAGRWNVSVSLLRNGRAVATRQTSLLAR